jgi:Ca2+/Na+ antiporter
MVIECKYEDLMNNINNICEFVTDNCEYSYFNFFSLHFCYLNQDLWLTIPIIIIIGLLCFFLLSDTSNRYLSNPLTILSDKLKISQNLAGLTFVAFGNGAADVISSIVASKDDSDGVEMTLGTLMGASVFVTSFVLSTVLIFARSIKVEKNLFIRDIVMFLFTLSIICVFSFDNKITLWESILFLSLYFIYLGIAVLQDKCSPQTNENKITDDIISKDEIIAHEIACDIEVRDRKESTSVKNDGENPGKDNHEDSRAEINIKNKVLESNSRKIGSFEYNINRSSFPNEEISIDSILKHDHFYFEKKAELLDHKNSSLNIPTKEEELKHIENISSRFLNFRYRIKKHYFQHKET